MKTRGGRTAIIGAMAQEIEALHARLEVETSGSEAGFNYWSGSLDGRACILAQSGMGKVASAACAQRLIDRWSLSRIIVCGLAGGLAQGLRAGDVIVGEGHIQHDVDASPIFPRYEMPGMSMTRIEPPVELIETALASVEAFLAGISAAIPAETRSAFGIGAPGARRGLIVTGDQFVKGSLREEIRASLPEAACVEMEGGSIAQVCHMNSIPFVVVRIVSDGADSNAAIDFSRFVNQVAPAYTLGIVRELLSRLPD